MTHRWPICWKSPARHGPTATTPAHRPSRSKRWRDGTDRANDPVLAGDSAAIHADSTATWVRIGPSMGFWLDEAAELYMGGGRAFRLRATLQLRNVEVRIFRWGD